MKKLNFLTKLLLLCIMIVGGTNGAWADDDPNLEVIFSRVDSENSTAAWTRYIKNYSTEGVTLLGYGYSSATTSFGTYSDYNSTRYYADNSSCSNNSSSIGSYYFSVKTSSKIIKKVSFLLTHNSTSSNTLTPVLFGWEGTPSTTADIVDDSQSKTISNRNYSDAQWYDYDFSSAENSLREVRLYRRMSKDVVTVDDTKIAQKGTGITFRIWGVRVWTETISVAPSTPTISINSGAVNGQTAISIGSTNAERIYYCWSDNEVAPEKGNAAYSSVIGASYVGKVPNVTATKYLHVYGYNSIGTTNIISREYNITKYQLPAGLSYSITSRSGIKGGSVVNTLTNPNELSVTYSISNNGTGSTINSTTGTITVGTIPGVETITATSDETDDYLAGEATYTLIVRADVSDIEAVSPGYVFIGANITNDGTTKLDADRLYDSNHIFSPLGNDKASSKGSSIFSDTKSYLNCIRLKSKTQDVLVFKVDRPCKVTFYAESTGQSTPRPIKVGTSADDSTYGTIPDSDPVDGDHTITITTAGVIYLTGTGDRFLAGFEVDNLTIPATIASSQYTTLASNYALNYEDASTESVGAIALTAYAISSITNTSVTLTSIEEAPGGEGLILKGTAGATYQIPVIASAETISNELSAAVTATAVESESVYVVSGGQLKLYTGTNVPAGKAYLLKNKVPNDARGLSFAFGDEMVTGILDFGNGRINMLGDFYDLSGRKVIKPSKGMYVTNGYKVIIK